MLEKTNLTKRAIVLLELGDEQRPSYLKIEQVVIRFEGKNSVDIGALCYISRDISRGNAQIRKYGRSVDVSTLSNSRKKIIKSFLSFIEEEITGGERGNVSLHGYTKCFCRFMDWVDANGYSNIFDDETTLKTACNAYFDNLQDRLRTNQATLDYLTREQNGILFFMSRWLDKDKLVSGRKLLRRKYALETETNPPNEEFQGKTLAICEAIFNGIYSFVMNNEKYPIKIKMPEYLNYPDNILWVFPTVSWSFSSDEVKNHGVDSVNGSLNYLKGEFRELNDMLKGKTANEKKLINSNYRNLKNNFEIANNSPRYWHRIHMAMRACVFFIPIFLSRLAISWSEFQRLTWPNEAQLISLGKRQRFAVTKPRANYQTNSYELPIKFMPLFQKYLALRRFVLKDYPDFEYLFFSMGPKAELEPKPITTFLSSLLRPLERIDSSLESINTKEWRAAKGNWAENKHGLATAAVILQNSESVAEKHYVKGNINTHYAEVSSLLEQLELKIKKNVQLTRHSSDGFQDTAVGSCADMGKPEPLFEKNIKANCEMPEGGCLFCNNLKIHVDKLDLRKLLSYRYCLLRLSTKVLLYIDKKNILERVDMYLNTLTNINKELVNKVIVEVNDGFLDDYWAAKYDMLLRLNLINDDE